MAQKKLDILIGIFSISIFIISGILYIKQNAWYEFFWLSNHWALVNGLAFLAGSRFLFSYMTVLGIVPELFWVVDFLFMLSGHQFLGVTNYWFDSNYPMSLKMIAIQHLFNPLFSIYGIARFGFQKNAWKGAIVHGTALFAMSLLFFGKEFNVNCAWTSCIPYFQLTDAMWRFGLVMGMVLHIFLATYLLNLISKRIKTKERHKNKAGKKDGISRKSA